MRTLVRHCVARQGAYVAFWRKRPPVRWIVRDEFGAAKMKSNILGVALGFAISLLASAPTTAQSDEADLIFRKSTTFKLLTPNDKLAVYGVDDPAIDGVACHYTASEKGGLAGAFGLAEQTSDISLACRQYGPIKIKEKFEQGDVVFRERRSLFFKKMQIVRGCDAKRNILIYMVYSDKIVDGSPKNSTSSVPIQPWGAATGDIPKCGDFVR
jgi:CreA protein